MHHELCSLIDKYKEMTKKMRASSLVDLLHTSIDLPYNAEVMVAPLPSKFRAPQMDMYDGSKDPLKHLKTFKSHMTMHEFLKEIACRAFLPLKEATGGWFRSLASRWIDNFEELAHLFLAQCKQKEETSSCLPPDCQAEGE